MERLVESLAGFTRTLTTGHDITDVLHELTERVPALLGIGGAGVSLIHEGRLRFVTCDSAVLADLEQLQEDGHGCPCLDALEAGEPVLVARLADDGARWPVYAQRARALGIGAVASIPMRVEQTIGTLDMYNDQPLDWTADQVGIGQVFADLAASYVRHASALERQRRTSEQLQSALDSRVIIEQAKGIIAAQRNITVDQAFVVLRKHANDRNANLRSVAAAVVNLGLRP